MRIQQGGSYPGVRPELVALLGLPRCPVDQLSEIEFLEAEGTRCSRGHTQTDTQASW